MSVRDGYKMTELGLIPNDWYVKTLDEIAIFKNGKPHENCISDEGEYVVINSKFISTNGEVFKRSTQNLSPLFNGDITLVMSDIPNGKALAKCFLVDEDDKYTLNQRICSIKPKGMSNEYLYYALNRNRHFVSQDDGVNQTNLKKEEILSCPVRIPPLPEQQRISEILSSNDALIAKTDELIEKTKEVKQGLMQELLTKGIGHTEFKDSELGRIPKEWEVKRLADVIDVNPNYKLVKGCEYDFVEMASLPTEGKNINEISKREFGVNSGSKFKNGDTLFARITPCTENGKCALVSGLSTEYGIGSTEFVVLSPNNEIIDCDYLFYYSKGDYARSYAINRMIGTTGRQRVPNEVFKEELLIAVPSLAEQRNIGSILTVFDEKLEFLTKRKQQLEEIKQGLMQDLLTGRVRVNLN